MSGGSFNYLCYNYSFGDAPESDLRAMADTLREMGYEGLAKETEKFMNPPEPSSELRDVWRAVEWWRSMDWSEDQAREVCEMHEKR
jgi:hypothetical protein